MTEECQTQPKKSFISSLSVFFSSLFLVFYVFVLEGVSRGDPQSNQFTPLAESVPDSAEKPGPETSNPSKLRTPRAPTPPQIIIDGNQARWRMA